MKTDVKFFVNLAVVHVLEEVDILVHAQEVGKAVVGVFVEDVLNVVNGDGEEV